MYLLKHLRNLEVNQLIKIWNFFFYLPESKLNAGPGQSNPLNSGVLQYFPSPENNFPDIMPYWMFIHNDF